MIDLHLHLDGSLAPQEVLQLAAMSGVALPCSTADGLLPLLEAEQDCQSLGEYLEKFDLPLQVLQTEETIAFAVYSLVKRLAEQGLVYAEVRFAPQLHLARGLTQEQVVAAAAQGLEKAIAGCGMPAQLILCCMRSDDNRDANFETVRVAKTFLGKGVCAVDLAGNEAAFPTKDFADVFSLAEQLGVPFIIHAGEAAGAESVYQALELGATRIGHGVRSIEDAKLLAVLQEKKVPLELCFTSNLQTKALKNAAEYPLPRYLDLGIPVTVNTDNMTVSGTDLRREYRLLQEQLQLSADGLKAIALNAANAAFVNDSTRESLKARIESEFFNWL